MHKGKKSIWNGSEIYERVAKQFYDVLLSKYYLYK